jgi:hypothetical protein
MVQPEQVYLERPPKPVSQDTSEAKGICASLTLKDEGVQDRTL